MTTQSYRVTKDHTSEYPDPITLRQGAPLTVGERYEGPEGWNDWFFCTTPGQPGGWVPAQMIDFTESNTARAREDYTARELDARAGDRLIGGRVLNGWVWCEDPRRIASGWVPLDHLQPESAPSQDALRIEIDDLSRPAVHELLREHLAHMHTLSPADKVFALDLTKLRTPDITFWTAWAGDALLGCGALRELTPAHGEIKSMRTPANARRRGAGRAVLTHIIQTARERGYTLLSLETGTHPAFEPAHQLYRRFGFEDTGPFADYQEDPHSVFMQLRLQEDAA